MMYEPLVEREYLGPEETEMPIDEDGNFYPESTWDASDVVHRLLNFDDNRLKPKQFKMKDQ